MRILGSVFEVVGADYDGNEAISLNCGEESIKAVPYRGSQEQLAELQNEAKKYWCIELGNTYTESDHDDRSFYFDPIYKHSALINGFVVENGKIKGFLDFCRQKEEYICIPIGQHANVFSTSDFNVYSCYYNSIDKYHCITAQEDFEEAIAFMRKKSCIEYADDSDIERFFSLSFDDVEDSAF